jgi:hypothetical protein
VVHRQLPDDARQRTSVPGLQGQQRLWNSGIEAQKNIARDRKRQQKYISNVLVIEDHAKPENNGKVFLFKYGPKIHEKIQEAISPKFPDQKPINPFDMWEGADFKLRSSRKAASRTTTRASSMTLSNCSRRRREERSESGTAVPASAVHRGRPVQELRRLGQAARQGAATAPTTRLPLRRTPSRRRSRPCPMRWMPPKRSPHAHRRASRRVR